MTLLTTLHLREYSWHLVGMVFGDTFVVRVRYPVWFLRHGVNGDPIDAHTRLGVVAWFSVPVAGVAGRQSW